MRGEKRKRFQNDDSNNNNNNIIGERECEVHENWRSFERVSYRIIGYHFFRFPFSVHLVGEHCSTRNARSSTTKLHAKYICERLKTHVIFIEIPTSPWRLNLCVKWTKWQRWCLLWLWHVTFTDCRISFDSIFFSFLSFFPCNFFLFPIPSIFMRTFICIHSSDGIELYKVIKYRSHNENHKIQSIH